MKERGSAGKGWGMFVTVVLRYTTPNQNPSIMPGTEVPQESSFAAASENQVTGLRCENPSRRTAAAASGLRGAAGQGHGEALLCRHQSKNRGGGGVGGHFRRLRRRRGGRPLFHGSTGSSTGSSTSGGGGGGSHGHDDHNHGPAQDGLLGLNPDNKNGAAGGDPGRLAAAAGAGAAVVAATAAAGETSSSSHGGHSHGGGMGHSHAHFHVDVASLKTRPALIRCLLRCGGGCGRGGGNCSSSVVGVV